MKGIKLIGYMAFFTFLISIDSIRTLYLIYTVPLPLSDYGLEHGLAVTQILFNLVLVMIFGGVALWAYEKVKARKEVITGSTTQR